MRYTLLLSICLITFQTSAKDALTLAYKRYAAPSNTTLQFAVQDSSQLFAHTARPWLTYNRNPSGICYVSDTFFLKKDSIVSSKQNTTFHATTQYTPSHLLITDFGTDKPQSITPQELDEYVFQSARYSPILLLHYYLQRKDKLTMKKYRKQTAYTLPIGENKTTIFINAENLIDSITVQYPHYLFGDITRAYIYSSHTILGEIAVPNDVHITSFNRHISERTLISSPTLIHTAPPAQPAPAGYAIQEKKEDTIQVQSERYNDHIGFIHNLHTDSRTVAINFKDFLMVIEAPLNSENGEYIIAEAHKLFPGKPIRYFAYSHHHPHYLGGVRSFIHESATILSQDSNLHYLQFIAGNPHTMKPDSLQLQPQPLKTELYTDKKEITDGEYIMQIHLIGNKSSHAYDFAVFYFPEEKLLFEGELIWIKKEGEMAKANPRQAGLYNAIKELHLDVKTIVQSWPLNNYGLKSIISFDELEQSAKMQ